MLSSSRSASLSLDSDSPTIPQLLRKEISGPMHPTNVYSGPDTIFSRRDTAGRGGRPWSSCGLEQTDSEQAHHKARVGSARRRMKPGKCLGGISHLRVVPMLEFT